MDSLQSFDAGVGVAAFSAVMALLALVISGLSYHYVRMQGTASASAARSAVLNSIFSSVMTDDVRMIRGKLLYNRPVEPSISDREGQIRELFAKYNRAAMMIGEDDRLKVMFIEYQKDEIKRMFEVCGPDLKRIREEGRPNYAFALRELHRWAAQKGLLD